MYTGIDRRQTVRRPRAMECLCPHPKAEDGMHKCRISQGLTHDYCCHEIKSGVQCSCRIQKAEGE